MGMQTTVFISYSPRDAGLAASITAELQKAGVTLIDPAKQTIPGKWRETIRQGIAQSKALLRVVGSPGAASNSWLSYEIGMFEAAGKPVIILASNSFGLSALPIEIRESIVRTFDPVSPEAAVRSVASQILAAA